MKKILVVDNNPMILEFMKEILEKEGYEVVTVVNSLSALDILERFTPEAIFVDLVMPGIDGEQLSRIIRSREELKETHIIILSGIAAEERKIEYTPLADAYIAKMPFKQMKQPILSVLTDLDQGNMKKYRDTVIGRDVLYQRDITNELLYSKRHKDIILSAISDGIIEITPTLNIIYINPAALQLTGGTEEQMLGSDFLAHFTGQSKEKIEHILDRLDDGPDEIGEDEPVFIGDHRVLLTLIPIHYEDYDSILVLLQDITIRKNAESIIHNSLQTKDEFIHEINHRVKNNLQLITSLLSLQSGQVTDERIERFFQESQNRVTAMALIHEHLHEQDTKHGIHLKDYIEDLLNQLIYSVGEQSSIVRTYVTVPESHIPLDTAVPLGLMINELVTNSLIHGRSTTEEENKIFIDIQEEQNDYVLTVRDNGPGFPEGTEIDTSESMGLALISILSQQLGGSCSLHNDEGAVAEVRFRSP